MLEFENLSKQDIESEGFEKIYHEMFSLYKPQALCMPILELLIVDSKSIQELNRIHRNQNTPTDVLSFPLEVDFTQENRQVIGSVVINIQCAKEVALKQGHSIECELQLLFIHGLLHIFGFDHERDSGEQRVQEEYWITKFNLPQSLIIRSQR